MLLTKKILHFVQNDSLVSFSNGNWNNNSIRFRNNSYMQVSVPEGYSLLSINFSYSSGTNRDLSVTSGTFSRNGSNVTWTATTPTTSVNMTNTNGTNYVYIRTINVEYIKLED